MMIRLFREYWALCFLLSLAALTGCQGLPSSVTPVTTTYALTVTAPSSGTGTITSAPAGINCPTTCSATFNSGTAVTLTAKPATNYSFGGWSGACSGTATCSVTMTAAETVAAKFAINSYPLTVTAPTAGTGTITSSPAGITCPGTCAANFNSGTSVTLTATPATNYTFGGWSGACSGTATCSIDVTAAETVSAT